MISTDQRYRDRMRTIQSLHGRRLAGPPQPSHADSRNAKARRTREAIDGVLDSIFGKREVA